MMCVKPRGACLNLHALRLLLVASGIKMILASETSGQKEVGRDSRGPPLRMEPYLKALVALEVQSLSALQLADQTGC